VQRSLLGHGGLLRYLRQPARDFANVFTTVQDQGDVRPAG
jgi:hypothetical protein